MSGARASAVVHRGWATADREWFLAQPTPPEPMCWPCIDAFAAAHVAEERERALSIVAAEEEMDGPMPDSLWSRCTDRESAAEVMRATVRATKRSIAAALRAPAERGVL